jgi:hypothetical protein
MPAVLSKRALAVAAGGALVLGSTIAMSARAQPATGTVTGRVVWGACIRGIPLPMTPDAQDQAQPQPGGPTRPVPIPPTGLPAGAVLVAVQNTSISARTDEAGRFTLGGVPAGQYLLVAAGPVADSNVAVAERPNIFVNGGQTADIGTLALGGSTPFNIACRLPLGVPDAVPGGVPPSTPEAPNDVPTPAGP